MMSSSDHNPSYICTWAVVGSRSRSLRLVVQTCMAIDPNEEIKKKKKKGKTITRIIDPDSSLNINLWICIHFVWVQDL